MVAVTIPVGPRHPEHCRWLGEALASVQAQTLRPTQIVVVDDMHGLREHRCLGPYGWEVTVHRPPWHLGVAHAFNAGIAIAQDEVVMQLGADDVLRPTALEEIHKAFLASSRRDGWYYLGVEYMDTGETQTLPCHASAITKGLMRLTGGLAPEAASGASDCAFVSMLMVNHPKALIPVADGAPLYLYRRHDATDTAARGPWQSVILTTRDILTRDWTAPAWGRTDP